MENILFDEDLLGEICLLFKLGDLITFGSITEFHKDYVRKNNWKHLKITLRDKIKINLMIDNYNFVNFNFESSDIDNDTLIKFKNGYSICLFNCAKITNVECLKKYNTVSVRSCKGLIVNSIGELGNCYDLDVSDTYITDDVVEKLVNCHKLDLTACKSITDKSVSILGNVHTLDVGDTSITDKSLVALVNCYELSLNNCKKITDNGVSLLGKCSVLDLSHTKISNKCLPYLTNCINLALGYTKITDDGLQYLFGCKKMYLTGCKKISDVSVSKLVNCVELYLDSTFISDEAIKQLSNCKKLILSTCVNVTGEGLIHKYDHVDLMDTHINSDYLQHIKSEILVISGSHIKDEHVENIQYCKKMLLLFTEITTECIDRMRKKGIEVWVMRGPG